MFLLFGECIIVIGHSTPTNNSRTFLTGKSGLMARAASLAQQWLADTGRVVSTTVAIRFCGASPGSGDVRRLLLSLTHQITYATNGHRHRIPHDYSGVKRRFRSLVQVGLSLDEFFERGCSSRRTQL